MSSVPASRTRFVLGALLLAAIPAFLAPPGAAADELTCADLAMVSIGPHIAEPPFVDCGGAPDIQVEECEGQPFIGPVIFEVDPEPNINRPISGTSLYACVTVFL